MALVCAGIALLALGTMVGAVVLIGAASFGIGRGYPAKPIQINLAGGRVCFFVSVASRSVLVFTMPRALAF